MSREKQLKYGDFQYFNRYHKCRHHRDRAIVILTNEKAELRVSPYHLQKALIWAIIKVMLFMVRIKMKQKENKDLHAGHRERLRRQFLSCGESMEQHQLLELLLTYSLPRCDTNRTAHLLLNRFKSFRGILSADCEELTSVEGIGKSSAILLCVIGELMRRSEQKSERCCTVYDTEEKLGRLFVKKYSGRKKEECYIAAFDGKRHMLGFKRLGEGTVCGTQASVSEAVKYALKLNACSVALAHNHPGGVALPSESDLRVTDTFRSVFSLMGIRLDGHFIVSDDDWYMIDGSGRGRL